MADNRIGRAIMGDCRRLGKGTLRAGSAYLFPVAAVVSGFTSLDTTLSILPRLPDTRVSWLVRRSTGVLGGSGANNPGGDDEGYSISAEA